MREKEFDKALEVQAEVVANFATHPSLPIALAKLGEIKYNAGDFRGADKEWEDALAVLRQTPEGEMHLFDVKTVSRRKDGSVISRTLKERQQTLGVRLLYVDRNTNECHLYPHQFRQSQYSSQQAANRQNGGVISPTISSLLHLKSSPTNQSSSEDS